MLILVLSPPKNMIPPFEVSTLLFVLYSRLLFVLCSRFESSTEVAMVRPPVTALWRCAQETMSLSSTGADRPWASPRRRHRWSSECSWMGSWPRGQRCSDSLAARNTRYIQADSIDLLAVGSWHGHFSYDVIFLKDKENLLFCLNYLTLKVFSLQCTFKRYDAVMKDSFVKIVRVPQNSNITNTNLANVRL